MKGTRAARDVGQTAEEEAAFHVVVGERESAAISVSSFYQTTQAAQEIGPGGREQMKIAQLAAGFDLIEQGQTVRETASHGDRNGAIDFDDGRWMGF